ncbi:MAG: hypothetical protein M1821_002373 [Bathelium mastoideum]|nr:MAG: hypothetical protein M1821_002373 [Bathelium mastoideum]
MTFEVLPVEQDDWPYLVSISYPAWGDDPIWNLLNPDLHTPEGQASAASRYVQSFDKNPEMQWMKVVDQDSGTIAGASCWLFFPEDPFSRDAPGEGVNKTVKTDWLGDEQDPTRQFLEFQYNGKRIQRKEFDELRRAHTYPVYRRQGVAKTALQWGLSRTDAMGVPCFLEASTLPYEARIYHKQGFCDVASMEFKDVRPIERRSRIPRTWHMCMIRPAKGEAPPQRREDQVHVLS